jgi:hypothetical protein
MSILEWEQIAIDRVGDASSSESVGAENSGSQRFKASRKNNKTSPDRTISTRKSTAHGISRDTCRGRAARVLEKDSWMDADDVSQAITDSSDINYALSSSGASSVLSDMHRKNDVVRREKSSGRAKYEYQLREDVVLE